MDDVVPEEGGGSANDDEEFSQTHLLQLAFLFSFFLTWNAGLSARAVAAVQVAFTRNVLPVWILETPIWILGIVAPVWLSYTQYGKITSVVALLFCVILPYGASVARAILLGPDAQQFYTSGTVSQDRTFGWWGCLLGLPRPPPPRQLGEDFKEHNLLLITKAHSQDPKSRNDSSQHVQMPKTDLLLPFDESCGICLEEYEDGDEIAWSKNPSCRHAFHANCLKEWLSTREKPMQVCPTCRESYHLEPVSVETPGVDASNRSGSDSSVVSAEEDSVAGDIELGSGVPQRTVNLPDDDTDNEGSDPGLFPI